MLDIVTNENLFLILLGLVWIIGAVLQDLKIREVDNIWNFSLIGFALAYRASASIWSGDYWFLLNGLIGLIIFFALGNLFYYSRLFAGGDAKLVMALGAVLPLSYNWMINFEIFIYFIIFFLVSGSVYALIYSIGLVLGNFKKFKKEFLFQLNRYKSFFLTGFILASLWFILSVFLGNLFLILISLIILLFPVLFTFAKSVEESCMIKKISPSDIREGDWLCRNIIVKGEKIKSDWEGISRKELTLIRNSRKKILIKEGIPFTPAFLFGFLGTLYWVWEFGILFRNFY